MGDSAPWGADAAPCPTPQTSAPGLDECETGRGCCARLHRARSLRLRPHRTVRLPRQAFPILYCDDTQADWKESQTQTQLPSLNLAPSHQGPRERRAPRAPSRARRCPASCRGRAPPAGISRRLCVAPSGLSHFSCRWLPPPRVEGKEPPAQVAKNAAWGSPSHPRVSVSVSVRMWQTSLPEGPRREALSPLPTCFFWRGPPEGAHVGKPLCVWHPSGVFYVSNSNLETPGSPRGGRHTHFSEIAGVDG